MYILKNVENLTNIIIIHFNLNFGTRKIPPASMYSKIFSFRNNKLPLIPFLIS